MGEVGCGRPRFERGVRGRTPLPGCCQVRVNQSALADRSTIIIPGLAPGTRYTLCACVTAQRPVFAACNIHVSFPALASQPYFPPCAYARMISGWGEGRVW